MHIGLILVALASLCWAALDALRKTLAGRVRPAPLAALLVIGQLLPFSIWVALDPDRRMTAGWLAPGLADVGCNLVASVLFMAALRSSPLSLTIPMLSLTPVFAAGTAALALGEVPAPPQLVGIALVVGGAFGLNAGGGVGPFAALRRERGALMMVGVASLWAVTMTLDKVALQHASVSAHALAQSAGIALGLLTALAIRGELGDLAAIRDVKGRYAAAVVAISLATGLQLAALAHVMVSELEGIKRAVGLAMAVVSGAVFFKEPATSRKIAMIALMGIGVGLLVGGPLD